MKPHRRDAVAAAVRASTRLMSERRPFRDGGIPTQVQETADLAADDIMEEMETQNAGLAPPKRKVVSPRAADFGKRFFDGKPVKELTRMELLMRDTRALRDERRLDREMARKFWCATATGYFLGFLSVTRRDFST